MALRKLGVEEWLVKIVQLMFEFMLLESMRLSVMTSLFI